MCLDMILRHSSMLIFLHVFFHFLSPIQAVLRIVTDWRGRERKAEAT